MKALVVYDSFFGNTEKIAQAVGAALGLAASGVEKGSEVKAEQLNGLQALIVGSPPRAVRPSPNTTAWLNALPPGALNGVKAAAFDTRIDPKEAKSAILTFFVKLFGYADKPMAKKLAQKGATLAGDTAGFFVIASEGPLKDGELERAAEWARKLTL